MQKTEGRVVAARLGQVKRWRGPRNEERERIRCRAGEQCKEPHTQAASSEESKYQFWRRHMDWSSNAAGTLRLHTVDVPTCHFSLLTSYFLRTKSILIYLLFYSYFKF